MPSQLYLKLNEFLTDANMKQVFESLTYHSLKNTRIEQRIELSSRIPICFTTWESLMLTSKHLLGKAVVFDIWILRLRMRKLVGAFSWKIWACAEPAYKNRWKTKLDWYRYQGVAWIFVKIGEAEWI